jgi:hypothetical protein
MHGPMNVKKKKKEEEEEEEEPFQLHSACIAHFGYVCVKYPA